MFRLIDLFRIIKVLSKIQIRKIKAVLMSKFQNVSRQLIRYKACGILFCLEIIKT
jgi:hypothetical protein